MAAIQSNRKWIAAIVVLGLLALTFMIVMIVYIVKYHQLVGGNYEDVTSSKEESRKANEVFSDLTSKQYKAIRNYMFEQTSYDLIDAANADLGSNYIFTIEAIVPPKADVIQYLDGSGSDIVRKAKVTIFLGADNPKSVKEVVVYPIDKPTNIEDFVNPGNRVPSWQSRPLCPSVEARTIHSAIYQLMEPLTPMLRAHYGQWLDSTCGQENCLTYLTVPRIIPGDTDRHVLFFTLVGPDVIGFYVWPASLSVIMYTPGNGDTFAVKSLYYDNKEYSSVQELVDAYDAGNVRDLSSSAKQQLGDTFGSPERRGTDVNPDELPPPVQNTKVQRFSVDGHHVEWLGWQFDFSFSPKAPAQLHNLAFNGERIAYHLGLQDVMVRYSGPEPNVVYRNYMDVGWNLGLSASSLVEGFDCPESAEYIDAYIWNNGFDEAVKKQKVACVFEYREHVPLRRHYSQSRFTMSMDDIVLVFRQILTVFNYDYVVDVEIHQTGVITSSVSPTGYVQVFHPDVADGIKYGYDLLPDPGILAVVHTHLFVYKVDLDIGPASSNNFMTLDLESESRPHPYNTAYNVSHIVMKKSMISTEQEAIINYDFTKPKEYVVYNQEKLNPRNNQPKGYRIQSTSFVYPIVPHTDPLSQLSTWNHHQIAVTRQKDEEPTTLSYFSQSDPYDPLISLKYFQEDNESIVNEDLVCWVTTGVNHIPTAEDIPVTTTAGKKMSFNLIPHNYYQEDPSMASRDGIIIEP